MSVYVEPDFVVGEGLRNRDGKYEITARDGYMVTLRGPDGSIRTVDIDDARTWKMYSKVVPEPAAISIPFAKLPEGLYIHGPSVGKDPQDGQHIIKAQSGLSAFRQDCPKCGGTNIDYLCKTWTYRVYCEDCKECTSPWLRTPGGLLGGPGKDNEPVDPVPESAPPC